MGMVPIMEQASASSFRIPSWSSTINTWAPLFILSPINNPWYHGSLWEYPCYSLYTFSAADFCLPWINFPIFPGFSSSLSLHGICIDSGYQRTNRSAAEGRLCLTADFNIRYACDVHHRKLHTYFPDHLPAAFGKIYWHLHAGMTKILQDKLASPLITSQGSPVLTRVPSESRHRSRRVSQPPGWSLGRKDFTIAHTMPCRYFSDVTDPGPETPGSSKEILFPGEEQDADRKAGCLS